MSYKFPDNLNYADTHEYVLEENGLLKIGVSEFAICFNIFSIFWFFFN